MECHTVIQLIVGNWFEHPAVYKTLHLIITYKLILLISLKAAYESVSKAVKKSLFSDDVYEYITME